MNQNSTCRAGIISCIDHNMITALFEKGFGILIYLYGVLTKIHYNISEHKYEYHKSTFIRYGIDREQ